MPVGVGPDHDRPSDSNLRCDREIIGRCSYDPPAMQYGLVFKLLGHHCPDNSRLLRDRVITG